MDDEEIPEVITEPEKKVDALVIHYVLVVLKAPELDRWLRRSIF